MAKVRRSRGDRGRSAGHGRRAPCELPKRSSHACGGRAGPSPSLTLADKKQHAQHTPPGWGDGAREGSERAVSAPRLGGRARRQLHVRRGGAGARRGRGSRPGRPGRRLRAAALLHRSARGAGRGARGGGSGSTAPSPRSRGGGRRARPPCPSQRCALRASRSRRKCAGREAGPGSRPGRAAAAPGSSLARPRGRQAQAPPPHSTAIFSARARPARLRRALPSARPRRRRPALGQASPQAPPRASPPSPDSARRASSAGPRRVRPERIPRAVRRLRPCRRRRPLPQRAKPLSSPSLPRRRRR